MRRCRKKTVFLVMVLTACCVSVYLCSLSVSVLEEKEEARLHRVEERQVVMNGQREILNVNVIDGHQQPVMVATVSSSSERSTATLASYRCSQCSALLVVRLVGSLKIWYRTCRLASVSTNL